MRIVKIEEERFKETLPGPEILKEQIAFEGGKNLFIGEEASSFMIPTVSGFNQRNPRKRFFR